MPGPAKAALNAFEQRFTKQMGADKVLIRSKKIPKYEVISTGSIMLDYATGVGGYVRGRIVETWGIEGSGKSTMALHGAREAQLASPDQMVGWIDMEQSLDRQYATDLGVDLERVYHMQPDTAEDVANAIKMMTEDKYRGKPTFSMVVVDSVGGMIPKGTFNTEAEKDARIGRQAAVVTRMVQQQAVLARQNNTVVHLINQVRANVSGFGKATTTGGGWALRHGSTMKWEIKKTGSDPLVIGSASGEGDTKDDSRMQVGQQIAVFIERNKVAPQRRTAMIWLITHPSAKYGPMGIDKPNEAFLLGKRDDIGAIKAEGAWYTLPNGERMNGGSKVIAYLREHPEEVEALRQIILASRAGEVLVETETTLENVEDEPVVEEEQTA